MRSPCQRQTVSVRAGAPVEIMVDLAEIPAPPEPSPPSENIAARPTEVAPDSTAEPVSSPSDPQPAIAVAGVEGSTAENSSIETDQANASRHAQADGGVAGWVPVAVLGGAGGAVLGGLVFGGLASQSVAERDALREGRTSYAQVVELDDAVRRHALVSNVLFSIGATAGVAGGLLWLFSDSEPTAASVTVMPIGTGWGLRVGGRL